MNKTKIETADYTWNPVTGCTMDCWFCYAREIARRWNPDDDFKPRFHPKRLTYPGQVKEPSIVMVCSMGDIFDPHILRPSLDKILDAIDDCPQHTFQIFTKRPERYREKYIFPDNAWLGTTAVNRNMLENALMAWAKNMKDSPHLTRARKFFYFEPLLQQLPMNHLRAAAEMADWFVVGALTGSKADQHEPDLRWIEDIITAAREFAVPVFLKDTIPWAGGLQEWPEGMKAGKTGLTNKEKGTERYEKH